ncbi:MAG: hypothetical protein ACREOU_02870 [Candidatus Eiseniibacteriota bacterium]
MTGHTHSTWAEILALLDDRARASEERLGSVRECPECRARFEQVESLPVALSEALDPGAPETWIERAVRRSVPRSYLAPLRGSHVAHVVFDSAEQRRAGVRSGAGGDRQWLLSTERIEIEIHLSDRLEKEPFELSGQLIAVEGTAPVLAGCRVRVEVEGETQGEVRTEPNGEFLLRRRPDRPFRLVVQGEGWEIATPVLTP